MELSLNLAWMVLTAIMCGLWMRYAPLKGASRRTQFAALALVLLILFPVISVTDDIVTAQNPAETDCLQRKNHAVEDAHHVLHPIADMILPMIAALSPESCQFIQLSYLPPPTAMVYAMNRIQNRPPPVA